MSTEITKAQLRFKLKKTSLQKLGGKGRQIMRNKSIVESKTTSTWNQKQAKLNHRNDTTPKRSSLDILKLI